MTMTTEIQDRPAPWRAVRRPAAPQPAAPQLAAPQPAASIFSKPRAFWMLNREASLNWLAFGLLLAAWNAAGDDASNAGARPEALRGYSSVSVRAAVTKASTNCKASCI
jgi:hypothetical protein